MRHTFIALTLSVLAAGPALSQAVPTRTLTRADAEFGEPFSQISGFRELKNGRAIVADRRDKTIQLIDFTSGNAVKIGREGSGPGEFGFPAAVYAAPGDSTWVYDLLNSRYLVIDPAGKAVGTFQSADIGSPQPDGPARRGGVVRGGGLTGPAQGVDALGRLYFRAPAIRFGPDGPSVADTTPIIRWDRKRNLLDTVGVLVNPPQPKPETRSSNGGEEVRVTVRIGGAQPFESADTYVVTAAGDVAVVRARDYHVDWIVKGKTVSGAPIRYDRVRVTDADKAAWTEAQKNATGTMVTNENGVRRVQNVPAQNIDPNTTFPQFKGPFENNVVATPNGQVWVPKHMPAGAPPTYDVIDNTGKLVSRVVLPKRTRLLGFGAGTVYLVRTDDDDLQYVQRYRL